MTDRPDEQASSFDDLPRLAGRTFVGEWMSVDDEHAVLFDKATYYDPAEWGWDVGSFPDDMLEGLHLLSLLPMLANRAMPATDPNAFAVAYGFDRVRFVAPVYNGQDLRVRGEVTEVRPKDEGYLILKHLEIEIRDQERPGVVADFWSFVMPRKRDEFDR